MLKKMTTRNQLYTQKLIIDNFFKVVFISTLIIISFACSKDDTAEELVGNWFSLSDFEGVPRSDAVAFTIGDKAYLGTGYDGSDRLNDFWEYDPQLNQWTRKADFPGSPRNGAVGFGTDTKGYIGTGYDETNKLKDFYEFDPATNTWDTIASFAGTARYGAIAFSINNQGFVGTGDDGNFLKDFWKYDPSTNQWTQIISLEGGKRRDAVAFVINGKAYVCTGIDNGNYEDDMWEYDPLTNDWNEKRYISNRSGDSYDDDYSDIIGTEKVAFSLNGKGYVVTGGVGSVGSSCWEYNPSTDLWKQKTSLEASARMQAVGFAISNIGYVTTGRSSSYYFDDLMGFNPDATQVDLDKIQIVQKSPSGKDIPDPNFISSIEKIKN